MCVLYGGVFPLIYGRTEEQAAKNHCGISGLWDGVCGGGSVFHFRLAVHQPYLKEPPLLRGAGIPEGVCAGLPGTEKGEEQGRPFGWPLAQEDARYMLGGIVTFLEAENEEKLLSFYRDNRFSQFDTRQAASDTDESHELVQLLRLLWCWIVTGKSIEEWLKVKGFERRGVHRNGGWASLFCIMMPLIGWRLGQNYTITQKSGVFVLAYE